MGEAKQRVKHRNFQAVLSFLDEFADNVTASLRDVLFDVMLLFVMVQRTQYGLPRPFFFWFGVAAWVGNKPEQLASSEQVNHI
jgi:hypothetical protein